MDGVNCLYDSHHPIKGIFFAEVGFLLSHNAQALVTKDSHSKYGYPPPVHCF